MAWYKTGTVAVTNGQTTVTGTGTKFATNARVGDGFNGPDGNWYEVTNIASETVIAIFPAYQGATLPSSANYMIAPLQGYNKESADRLRAITDSITVVTSVAGRTGNVVLNKSDVGLANVDNTADVNKPISTPQANGLQAKITSANKTEVQTTLGLVPTQGFIDNTAGRILKVGDYGFGGAIPIQDANQANTINGATYKLVNPFSNGPTPGAYIIQTFIYDAEVTQLAYLEGSPAAVAYMRQYRASWQPWTKLATASMAGEVPSIYSGNIDDLSSIPYGYVTITSSSTGTKPTGKSFGFLQTLGQAAGPSSATRQIWNDFDGTVGTKTTWVRDKYGNNSFGNWRLIYDQNTVVGTVVNPAVVANSSIIEYNSNVNGSYIRFVDGTQIAWRRIGSNTTSGYSLGSGGLIGGDAFGGSVPINFISLPTVTCSITTTSGNPNLLIASQFGGPTASSFGSWRAVVVDQAVLNVGVVINLIAVGRWY